MTNIDRIKIILVEPAGERNIGSIARVMRNMALSQLVLVNPRCDHLSSEAKIMAVHGVKVLEQAQVFDSLPHALQGCQKAIATTARPRGIPTQLETPREVIPWLIDDSSPSALIFGPEDRGLSNQELSYAQRFVCIQANPDYPSLNLAQAVGICAYELYEQAKLDRQSPVPKENNQEMALATLNELEGYYQHLETILLKINYIYPHTASNRMEKLRRIVNRSQLTSQELAMLRGILRQVDWGINNQKKT